MSQSVDRAFRGRVVWITGASSGIGQALAIEAHSHGATLVLSARGAESLHATARLCTGPARVHLLPLDLTEAAALPVKARRALDLAGPVDFMIHCAGVACRDLAGGTSLEVDRMVMETNYFGPLALTKALLPSMLERGSGTFVVISSLTGRVSVPLLSAYAASKHALEGFFDALRSEVHSSNLRVTTVVPGFVRTPITRNAVTGDGRRFDRSLTVHEQGMDPRACARRILVAVANEREEILIGGVETGMVWLQRLSRRLVSIIVRNHPVQSYRRFIRGASFGLFGGSDETRASTPINSDSSTP